ncbi:MAG: tyrosine-type recombinase/integrase [Nocardioidaceae bacterium]
MREPVRKVTLKDGSIRYRVVVDVGMRPDGRRDQRTSTHPTAKQARAAVARIRSQVDTGNYVRPAKETVDSHLDSWLQSKRLSENRPATIRCYTDALKAVRSMLGSKPLQALTAEDVETVKAAMLDGTARRVGVKGKPLSARAVNLTLGTLRQALDQAVKRGKVTRNVAALVDHAAGEARPGAAWTPAQAAAFKEAASADRLHAAWLLTCCGLRRGEVLGLEWQRDLDLDDGTVTIAISRTVVAGQIVEGPPKTRRGARTLPLDATLVAALRKLRTRQSEERLAAGPAAYDGTAGKMVVDELGRPPRPEWYSDTFARLARQAEVPVIRLHDARHTSVTIMRSLGIPAHVVAAWHGHDEAVMARTYTHTYLDELRAAAEQLAGNL